MKALRSHDARWQANFPRSTTESQMAVGTYQKKAAMPSAWTYGQANAKTSRTSDHAYIADRLLTYSRCCQVCKSWRTSTGQTTPLRGPTSGILRRCFEADCASLMRTVSRSFLLHKSVVVSEDIPQYFCVVARTSTHRRLPIFRRTSHVERRVLMW